MHQIHDKGYKRLFKNKGIFRQLLETFVAKDWVKELDFESSETLDKSFVSEQYKETVSDIIHKIKLKQQDLFKEYLLKIRNVVSLLFLAESYYDTELLEREFLEVFEREKDKGPISLLLNWFIQLCKHGRIPEEDVDKLERIYESKEEVRAMLISALEKEKKEIYEKGLLEGEIRGEIRGEIKQRTETARKMLAKGFDLPLIAEVTGLSDDAIIKLKQEMDAPRN